MARRGITTTPGDHRPGVGCAAKADWRPRWTHRGGDFRGASDDDRAGRLRLRSRHSIGHAIQPARDPKLDRRTILDRGDVVHRRDAVKGRMRGAAVGADPAPRFTSLEPRPSGAVSIPGDARGRICNRHPHSIRGRRDPRLRRWRQCRHLSTRLLSLAGRRDLAIFEAMRDPVGILYRSIPHEAVLMGRAIGMGGPRRCLPHQV